MFRRINWLVVLLAAVVLYFGASIAPVLSQPRAGFELAAR
jgi:hypothetical protein